jgi:hypothetical protein
MVYICFGAVPLLYNIWKAISISNGHLPCCLLLFDSDYGPSTAATKIVEILKTIVIGGPKRNENEMIRTNCISATVVDHFTSIAINFSLLIVTIYC